MTPKSKRQTKVVFSPEVALGTGHCRQVSSDLHDPSRPLRSGERQRVGIRTSGSAEGVNIIVKSERRKMSDFMGWQKGSCESINKTHPEVSQKFLEEF